MFTNLVSNNKQSCFDMLLKIRLKNIETLHSNVSIFFNLTIISKPCQLI